MHRATLAASTRRSLLSGIAACLVSGTCSILDPACTLVGCGPSLIVEFTQQPAGLVRVEATPVGSQDRRVVECVDTGRCDGGVYFDDFTPEEVVIRITTDARTTAHTFRPSYEVFHPNGRRCPPTCRQARIRVPSSG